MRPFVSLRENMLYAIISDVHANLEAVTACFEEIDKINPDRIICLGDLVDYCAEPNEVIEIIRKRCDVVLLGNHDEAQYDFSIPEWFREFAKTSSFLTRSLLSKKSLEYIKTLPRSHFENNILFVHASPKYLPRYKYVLDTDTAYENFTSFNEQVCFIGHSHRPVVFRENDGFAEIIQPEAVTKEGKYIINVGSVGQPRDGNPKLAFGVFNSETFEYQQIRVDYDIKTASEKIIKLELPESLASRLFNGL